MLRMERFRESIEMISPPKIPISECSDDSKLAVMMKNAKARKQMDYWWQCLHRRCEIARKQSVANPTELEKSFNEIMRAYEILRSEVKGRKIYASYTWRKVKKDGAKPVLEKWALSKAKQDGFKFLLENGQHHLTGEYLILRFGKEFPPKVVAAARKSLLDAEVPEEELPAAQDN
jgi:hypothetical protein